MSYRQLSRDERIKLAALIQAGKNQKDCTRLLGRDKGTISRELSRNKDPANDVYEPRLAHRKAAVRRRKPEKKLVANKKLQKYVITKLISSWSPEQVAGRLELERKKKIICHETIYQFIYKDRRDLIPFLRQARGRRYRRRYGTKIREKRRETAKKRWIHERPEIIDKRGRIGDWEGDTIIGQEKEARLLTHVERKSGFLFADKVADGQSWRIRLKTKNRFRRISKDKKFSCTYDNGVEFSDHEFTEHQTGVPIYFCHSYSSWERGTCENTNGLIRQFFPKKTSFTYVSQNQINRAVNLINHRPRKRHNYLTPVEVFTSCT